VIHLLIVARDEPASLGPPPDFEVLWAHSPDEAVEKLARNRRIDAVLFFDDATARETLRVLAAEGAGSPPLFGSGDTSVEGVVLLAGPVFEALRANLGG
jgi:hypothetical protein